MKYVYLGLCVLMVLFAGVQYNDPDFYFWVPVYLVPAAWAALAAFRPDTLRRNVPRLGLIATTILAVVGVGYYWPKDARWWRQDVWWESELAREGMGIMIVAAVVIVVMVGSLLAGRRTVR